MKTRTRTKPDPSADDTTAGKGRLTNLIGVRVDDEQDAGLKSYVEDLNARRVAAGLKEIALATWGREVMLRAAGLDRLTEDGRAKARAEMTPDFL